MTIPTLQPGCPWYELSSWALPNVKWCEASRCSIITEPANTWSNLAYIILGILILVQAQPHNKKTARLFGYSLIFVGLSSGIYHASYTFAFQVLDFVAMYVLTLLLVALNLQRWKAISDQRLLQIFFGGTAVFTLLTLLFYKVGIPIQSLVLSIALFIVFSEFKTRQVAATVPNYKYFKLGMLLIVAAATCSALDVTRTFCIPDHPFLQGHAAWHVLSASCIYVVYFFYAQFDKAS